MTHSEQSMEFSFRLSVPYVLLDACKLPGLAYQSSNTTHRIAIQPKDVLIWYRDLEGSPHPTALNVQAKENT